MILYNLRANRSVDDVDFSDLTPITQGGPAFWHETIPDALVIPFVSDVPPDVEAQIRRRLVTSPERAPAIDRLATLLQGLKAANLAEVPYAQNDIAQELLIEAIYTLAPELKGESPPPATTPEV